MTLFHFIHPQVPTIDQILLSLEGNLIILEQAGKAQRSGDEREQQFLNILGMLAQSMIITGEELQIAQPFGPV